MIWDLVAHSCLPPLPAHKGDITGLSFSPDSTLLATCAQVRPMPSSPSLCCLAASLLPFAALLPLSRAHAAAAPASSQRRFHAPRRGSCSTTSAPPAIAPPRPQDCAARVWDARSGRELAFFVADAALTSCCFAGGGGGGAGPDAGGLVDIMVVVDAGGAAHFLDLPLELQPGGSGA